jgi:hypothetical protein
MTFVRVVGPDGAEFTISERAVKSYGDVVTVLHDRPAVDANGRPLPPKSRTDLAGQPSQRWKRDELASFAAEHGIPVDEGATKPDILAAIEAADINDNPEA